MGDYLLMVQTQSHLPDEQDTHVALPLWVKSAVLTGGQSLPVFPDQQTF
jgi:hypothetical protein